MTDADTLPWKADHADVTRRLEALPGTPGVSADYVHARIAILKAQVDVLEALCGVEGFPVDAEDLGDGPPVRPEMLRFDHDVAANLLAAVIDACRRQGRDAQALEKVTAAAAQRPDLVEELGLRVTFEPEPMHVGALSKEIGAPGELLVFLARLVAAPFVLDAARRLEELPGATAVSEGSCPICGSPPGLATLEAEDGRRVLHCSLCGWSWRFARLACPLCGCGDQAKLQRLSVDGEDARWIEGCRECHGYLKTIDRRRLTDSAALRPLVEEVATLYLDLLAEREGYAANLPYAAMI